MQPKFTLKDLGFVRIRIIVITMILGLITQFSFSQKQELISQEKISPDVQAARERQKLAEYNGRLTANQSLSSDVPSVGPAPFLQSLRLGNNNQSDAANPLSRAFCYTNGTPTGNFQFRRQSLDLATTTNIGTGDRFGFPGASALVTTMGRLYVIDQSAPFALYYIDTLTGVRAFVANCTGVPQANFTGLTWDPSTNTMYGISTSITASQIFTVNITNGVCTPIGSPSTVSPGAIMLNAAPGGSLFGVDIVNDNLYRWNKTTGVPTLIGSLGYNANFGQDGHFDFSDGQYYWAAIGTGSAQLRLIDTITGNSTFIANYVGTSPAISQTMTLGIFNAPTVACTGTPNPGNTLSSVTNACAGTSFILSLQNQTPGTGVNYQWQSAPSSTGPWSNVGPNSHMYATSLTTATWYRCIVTCGSSSGTSNPVQVVLAPPTSCYCAAGATSTSFEKISRVQFHTIDNSSSSTAGYENFTSITASVVKGQTIPATITISGAFSTDQTFIWIDFNQNGSFSDPGELVFTSSINAGPHIGNVTISPSALTGTTRMRIRMHDSGLGPNSTPCGNSSYGQVEDYTLDIQPCIPLSFTTQPSNSTITCGGNTTFSATVAGSFPTYAWEYRVNASSPWLFVPNSAPFSGVNTSTLTLTDVNGSYNGYQFRVVVQGPCTATDFSNIATLTVNQIIPVVNPSSAVICLGSVQQLSLTNTVSSPTTVTFNATTGLPLVVPDGNATGILTAPLAVSGIPAGSVIKNVQVKFTMTHTWVGDIVLNLKAPNNQVLNLIGLLNNGSGNNSTADFTNTVIDSLSILPMSGAPAPRTNTFRADRFTVGAGALGVAPTTTNNWLPLLGTMNGNWQLAFSDLGAGDVGTLTSWSLTITYVAPVFAQGTWTGPAGTMFTDAAATVPYTGTPATTIYVKPTATGVNNYNVSFTTSTPCTSATTVVPITVHSPVTGITSSPATRSVCLGGSTTFTASTTGGTPVNYQWQLSLDGGVTYTNISGATSATLTVSNVTSAMTGNRYRVTTTGNVCGTYTSAPSVLTVLALPTVSITSPVTQLVPGRTTSITASSTPAAATATSWSWSFNGSPLVTTPASNTNTLSGINIDRVGSYQATVTDVNGCVNSSNVLVIGTEASDRLWIYPNPTTGQFQVRLYYGSDVAEKRAVHIYDQLGQIIMTKEFNLVTETPDYLQMDFDLSKQARGVYVVKVVHKYSGKIVSGLVIKQ